MRSAEVTGALEAGEIAEAGAGAVEEVIVVSAGRKRSRETIGGNPLETRSNQWNQYCQAVIDRAKLEIIAELAGVC
ncbi:hypothetical protein ASE07_07880 [Noviherbaspirillum sp. Root189]|nr:hypothetical protein ASE07_07880 [Noviherbaspirillum sp. Root189]